MYSNNEAVPVSAEVQAVDTIACGILAGQLSTPGDVLNALGQLRVFLAEGHEREAFPVGFTSEDRNREYREGRA